MLKTRIDDLIRPEITALSAYPVADAEGFIKLDAMENPYSWPENLRDEWAAALRAVEFNRYPDPAAAQLKAILRRQLALPDGVDLLLGNGSDELILLVLLAIARSAQTAVIAPEPSFVMYKMLSCVAQCRYVGVPLQADGFALDMQAMLAAISRHRPAAVFLAYPNNPTGNLFARAEIEQIVEAAPGLVVIDEAYFPFSRASFVDDLNRWDNVLVMRTLSKSGLAGLRLGMLLGARAWLEEINKIRLPYNINSLSQAGAAFVLRHEHVLRQQVERICADRERLYVKINSMDGMRAWPSQTNFLAFRVVDAERVFVYMKQRKILLKKLHGGHPLLTDCLRVSIGTGAENDAFLEALAAAAVLG